MTGRGANYVVVMTFYPHVSHLFKLYVTNNLWEILRLLMFKE